MKRKPFSRLFAVLAALAFNVSSAAAQSPARFALDSVAAIDEFHGGSASDNPQIVIDISAAVRLGDRWQLLVRPWFRLPHPGTPTASYPPWDKELYQAGVRYEQPGPVAVRVDAGYIVSPIGLGLFDARPNLNPTIVPHLSYVVPMPPFDPAVPRVEAVAVSYPLGAQLTVSTDRWDARAAIVNSAPTREYAVGNDTNPRQTPVVVAGAGITPTVGLRLGVSAAHGDYATADEATTGGARSMTMVGGEGEYSCNYAKISGEVLRTAFDIPGRGAVATEWFVQGTQTLAPRWFAAARFEGTSAPPLYNGIAVGSRTTFKVVEATLGFRVNPDVTVRGSFYNRLLYGSSDWDQQAGVSVVWARRWW